MMNLQLLASAVVQEEAFEAAGESHSAFWLLTLSAGFIGLRTLYDRSRKQHRSHRDPELRRSHRRRFWRKVWSFLSFWSVIGGLVWLLSTGPVGTGIVIGLIILAGLAVIVLLCWLIVSMFAALARGGMGGSR